MQTQSVLQIGNSTGIVIPNDLRRQMGLKKGSKVVLELGADRKTLIVSKAGRGIRASSVTPEFIRILKGVNKRYGSALARLAKL